MKTKLDEYREEITKIDEEMAALFTRRMEVSSLIGTYKKENGLPVYDPIRESENLLKGKGRVKAELQDYYARFLQKEMDLSKEYQKNHSGERENAQQETV